MNGWLFLVAIVFAYPNIVDAKTTTPIVIIVNNQNYERGSLPRKGDWLGLYCNKSDCHVRKANISVIAGTSQTEDILGKKEKVDILSVRDRPIALFHGVTLRPGPVTTWFMPGKSHDSPHYQQLHC